MNGEKLNLPREQFAPVVSQPMELDALGKELTICFQDISGPCEIKTCYGDVCKIVNALRDYSRLLRMVCEEWNLQGFHQAVYEHHAEVLEKISKKYQAGIGYDYDKAVEKCRKKRGRKQRDDDAGGEAMMMAYLKSQRTAKGKGKSDSAKSVPEAAGLKAEQVEHYDFSDDVIAFWVDVSGVPQDIQAKARQIDGMNFNPDCFGICVNYDLENYDFSVIADTEPPGDAPCNIYYIDSTGEKHGFCVELPQMFLEQLFLACVGAVANENCVPTEGEARQSAVREAADDFAAANMAEEGGAET